LLYEEIWCADVDSEQIVEVCDRHLLNHGRFRDPGIRDDNVESVADQIVDLRSARMGPIGSGKIGADRIVAGRADLIDHRFGFVGLAAVMHDDASAGGGERQGDPAHSARGAGDESGLVGEVAHDGISLSKLGRSG
jgi:hypothetical protein